MGPAHLATCPLQSLVKWESENKMACEQRLLKGEGPKTSWTRELTNDGELILVSPAPSKPLANPCYLHPSLGGSRVQKAPEQPCWSLHPPDGAACTGIYYCLPTHCELEMMLSPLLCGAKTYSEGLHCSPGGSPWLGEEGGLLFDCHLPLVRPGHSGTS
jgi:hypothetical protein